MLVARALAFLTAIPFHEAAHAYVSDKLGDSTARDMGRLTLNPIKHLDLWGLVAMLVVGIGWAKPVPVNVNNYQNKKLGMAVSSLAGPVSNLLLAYILMVLFQLATGGYMLYNEHVAVLTAIPTWFEWLYNILFYMAVINVNLAVFNLIPIPPLDGSRILLLFLPEKVYFGLMKYERFLMIGLILLMFFGVLSRFLSFVNGYVLAGFDWATGWVHLLMGVAY